MEEKLKSVECFKTALIAIVRDLQTTRGKTVKADLAAKAETSLTHLSDIATGRKVGSEDIRRRIAEALGYNYCDFIEIGRKLLQGISLSEAKNLVLKKPLSEQFHDEKLKEIVSYWPELTLEQHNLMFANFKDCLFKNWKHYDFIRQLSTEPSKIFHQIWRLTCEDSGEIVPFGESTFALIRSCDMDLATIYYEAKNYVKTIKAGKSSEKA